MPEAATGAGILIVEDHPTMREAMRMVLEQEGFRIREAADGSSALALAREDPPDLVFLDEAHFLGLLDYLFLYFFFPKGKKKSRKTKKN